jgi:hypothetical protein
LAGRLRGEPLIDLILRFVTLGSVLIGAAAIYTAVRNNTRQLGAQIFLSYSDRIQTLRRTLPGGYVPDRFIANGEALTPEARRYVMEVLQLVFELHALKRHGYVDKHIWRVWEPDIDRLLRSGVVRSEWPTLNREFETHPKFVAWVASRQGGVSIDPADDS